MLCHSYRLLALVFALAVAEAHKESSTTGLTSAPYPTSETDSLVTVTECSTELSKTKKHPHSKYSTGTASSNTPPIYTGPFTTKSTTPVPSTTVSTVTSTTSKIPPTCVPTSFKLKVALQYTYPNPPAIDGNFISIVPYTGTTGTTDVSLLTADASAASTFTLNADCTLNYGTEIQAVAPLTADSDFAFYSPAFIASNKYDKTTCQISGTGLTCLAGTGTYYSDNVFRTCSAGPYYLTFAPDQRPNNYCYALLLVVVPI